MQHIAAIIDAFCDLDDGFPAINDIKHLPKSSYKLPFIVTTPVN